MHCLSSVNNHELVIIDGLMEIEGFELAKRILMRVEGANLNFNYFRCMRLVLVLQTLFASDVRVQGDSL